jgi:hypothetical protein
MYFQSARICENLRIDISGRSLLMPDVLPCTRDPKTYAVIGAAMEVHRQLRRGFSEPVYQEALARELGLRGIPFEKEKLITIYYKGEAIKRDDSEFPKTPSSRA